MPWMEAYRVGVDDDFASHFDNRTNLPLVQTQVSGKEYQLSW